MKKIIDKINTSGVVTTFHKDDCKAEWYCKCSEEEGMNIKEKCFYKDGIKNEL